MMHDQHKYELPQTDYSVVSAYHILETLCREESITHEEKVITT